MGDVLGGVDDGRRVMRMVGVVRREARGLLQAVDRFNAHHPWSHNDAYWPVVVDQARRVRRAGGTRAVDVGCGTGNLVRRLARVMPAVTGIEADSAAAAVAQASVAHLSGVRVVHAGFTGLPERSVDLVTFVAVLHHLPLAETLRTVRGALRPGGRLVVIGCYREVPADRLLSLVSLVLNPIVGAVVHPRRSAVGPVHMTAPTMVPRETFDEVVDHMRAELPGVSVRRGLFWRYTALWTVPDE